MNDDILEKVSYCGIYCGRCSLLCDNIADQAVVLAKKLKEIQIDKWGPGLAAVNPAEMAAFEHVDKCLAVLAAWDHMRCHDVCRKGGGSTHCAIRDCCLERNLTGCFACDEYRECQTLGALKTVNGSLNLHNIEQIREKGVAAFGDEMETERTLCFYRE